MSPRSKNNLKKELSLSLATMPASGHVYSHCLTRHTKHETGISAKVVVVELEEDSKDSYQQLDWEEPEGRQ